MKTYSINKTRNIGDVIFVVEGGRSDTGGTELRLLKKIFADILCYEVQELRRGTQEFIAHGANPKSRVFALNLPHNQLTMLNADALDNLFRRIKDDFHLKPENCPIFFLYDRDVLSYHRNELRGKYVKKYTDPYGTSEGDQGQLLLSYPSIESYLLSCIENESYNNTEKLGKDAKITLLNSLGQDVQDSDEHQPIVDLVFSEQKNIAEERLLHSINEMDQGLKTIGIDSYDLDNLASTLLKIYDCQQQKYMEDDVFYFLSIVGMAFLELGVITCNEDEME